MGETDKKVESKVHESQITDFSDLPDDTTKVDIPLSVDDILEKEVIILGFTEMKSEYGKGYYLLIEATMDGEIVEIATGARHVLKQLDKAHTHLPIMVRFKKQGRSYYLA